MFFQCVLLLALSLIQNEAADRFSFSQQSGPGRAFRPLSSKLNQGSFDTAAELAKLINEVKKEAGYKNDRLPSQPIVETSTQKDDTHLQAIFNVIKEKINNEGVRIHVLKNTNVLDRYMKDNRGMYINNPHILDKYVNEIKNQKAVVTPQPAGLKSLLKRRNAVFRLDDPEDQVIKDLVKPAAMYGSKRFNKVTNIETDRIMSRGRKPRDMIDQSREIKKSVTDNRDYRNERENRGLKDERQSHGYNNEEENRGFKNERENRGFKDMRENRGFKDERENRGFKDERENRGFKDVPERGFDKRDFKDYSEYKTQGNPNLARPKPLKISDYDYDKPKKPMKTVHRDYDERLESKKRNIDKFDDYGPGNKKGDSWDKSVISEPKRKPVPKMDYNDKPSRNFDNSERRRPKKDESWEHSIKRGFGNHNARSSQNNEGHNFGNTAIPFNRPRNIYANENSE